MQKERILRQRLLMCYWIEANSKDNKMKELYREIHAVLKLEARELRKKLNMTDWD